MRLRLVPGVTNYNFFRWQWVTFGASVAAVVTSIVAVLVMGLLALLLGAWPQV